ncbi:MAG: hypothetical protein MJK12_01305 [Colwellia sp.]|nr:hypothetical protein [Colwellia sp.]
MGMDKNSRYFNEAMIFQVFKYSIYILLAIDIYHFFVEDYSASSQTFAKGVSPSQIIEAFTATIDTAAWLILLLIFELETYILDDEKIKGKTKWAINAVRLFCYLVILYSFYGFLSKFNLLHTTIPFINNDVCSLVGTSFTYIKEIDKYLPLTADVCKGLANIPLIQIVDTQIITTQAQLIETQRLSTVEVTNSATWLFVVCILEVEVFLQLRGKLTKQTLILSKWLKYVLYTVLFIAAAYWGIKGGLLDFWDAFLWLVAFWFIEVNIFKWNAETNQDQSDEPLTEKLTDGIS